jgi:hypothetical protein
MAPHEEERAMATATKMRWRLVGGEEHRARLVLPQGFEFQEAEMGKAVVLRVNAGDRVRFEHHHTSTQLCAIDWSHT